MFDTTYAVRAIMQQGHLRQDATNVLAEIAKRERAIPEAAINALAKMLKDENLNYSATNALKEIAKGVGVIPTMAINVLIEILKDIDSKQYYRERAADALKELVKCKRTIPESAIDTFLDMLNQTSFDDDTKVAVCDVLGEMGRGEKINREKIRIRLLEIVNDIGSYPPKFRLSLASALLKVSIDAGNFSKVALDNLLELLNNDSSYRLSVVLVFEKIAKSGRILPELAINALIDCLKDRVGKRLVGMYAVSAIGKSAKNGAIIPERAADALIKNMFNTAARKSVSEAAARPLEHIISKGGVISEKNLDVLINITTTYKGLFWSSVSDAASFALREIINRANSLSTETLYSLVMRIKELMGERLYIEEDIEHLISLLGNASASSLIQTFSDTGSFELALRICYLTRKAFTITDGKIHISDQHQQVSFPCPPEVDVTTLASIDFTTAFLPNNAASSSLRPSSSSSRQESQLNTTSSSLQRSSSSSKHKSRQLHCIVS